MVRHMNYDTISHVLESWEQLKRIPDYEVQAGTKLFRRLFERSPESKVLFGFPIDIDTSSDELLKSKRFHAHAAYMLEMIDTALNMLGPDSELLTEIMAELGEKHVRFGVKAEMFAIMGEALLDTLEASLGESWTSVVCAAWEETYSALSDDMVKAQ